jgi:prophage antirepressor-like protein
MSQSQSALAPVVFDFQSQPVRVVVRDGDPWFVASDVAEALEYKVAKDLTRILDDDEKGGHNLPTLGGNQDVSIISESGLYHAILKSRKPKAKPFRRWVTGEVLPVIRKTGMYLHAPAMRPGLTAEQKSGILGRIHRLTRFWFIGESSKMWIFNHLRVAFQVGRWEDIPSEAYPAALSLIDSKTEAANQYSSFLRELGDYFDQECLGGGLPWTPAIQRKLSMQFKRKVILPPKVDWLALADTTKKAAR